MGCDIHLMFETKRNGAWEPTWTPKLSKMWHFDYVYKKIEDGSAITAFGPAPEGEDEYDYLHDKVTEYIVGLPEEEVVRRFGSEVSFDFIPKDLEGGDGIRFHGIVERNYAWFIAICRESVQHRFSEEEAQKLAGFSARGVPEDASDYARNFTNDDDGHSVSWLTCREILDSDKCQINSYWDEPFGQRQWIVDNIKDIDNTRMIFFFDN